MSGPYASIGGEASLAKAEVYGGWRFGHLGIGLGLAVNAGVGLKATLGDMDSGVLFKAEGSAVFGGGIVLKWYE
jgi:hypothetical protein